MTKKIIRRRNRSRRKNKAIITFAVLIILLLGGHFSDIVPSSQEEGLPSLEGPYPVTRVVDGDTIVVQTGSSEEKIRLIGIDTPESVHSDAKKNTSYGKIASDYTKKLLEGKIVYLEFDVSPRDKYGRLLAYVYLDNKMVNEMLLTEGHARAATYPPNVKYAEHFYQLQTEARENRKGAWATNAI